jgi:hypothetical protein
MVMTQFPLHDNLTDARRARREGYAGTLSDGRLVWFQPDRRLTVPAAAVAALATLLALAALAMPVVAIDPASGLTGDSRWLSLTLGYHYTGMWLVACAIAVASVLAVAGSAASGGPTGALVIRLVAIVAAVSLGAVAVTAAAYLLTHSIDLALQAFDRSGPLPIPKGHAMWLVPPWPVLRRPGVGLWVCLAAGITSLAATALFAVNVFVVRGRSETQPVRPGSSRDASGD